MEILANFVGKVLDFTLVPVGRQFGYVLFYSSNIKRLQKDAEKLNATRKDVENLVGAAEDNNEEISENVQLWKRDADEIIQKAERFFDEDSHAKTGCSHRSCPNIWSRYKLSREAKNMATEVGELNEKGNFQKVSTHRKPPESSGHSSAVREPFQSRVSIMNEIMEALADPAIQVIGLCGLGGVGKTTLAKQVGKKARDEKLFDKVLFVDVKQNPIKEIQSQIADRMALKFDLQSESELTRADFLRGRLEQEKSLLVVLDDLWKRLDFDQIGIPATDMGNTHCKFILTSRNVDLLSSQMNCERNIMVGLLSDKEAWVLFKETAEINENSDDRDLVSKADEVCRKCAQLPVAIVAVARALRNNKSLVVWKDALQQLKSYSGRNISGIEEVDSSIKLSYDCLKPELKSTFLLSAMFSQDPLIMDLFMYAFGLGYLEGVHNMEAARNRLDALVGQLKASSLLLDSYSKDRFTIHDVVRDVTLSIAFEEQHALVKRHEKVDEWPNEDQLESCTAICLDQSDIDELPIELFGPKVKFFFLESKDPELNIPSSFFNEMKELKVLSLSNLTFSLLPSSISHLSRLITLSLHSCMLEDITGVERLKQLQILNLSHSRIKQLPCEVGQLSCLKILNLSSCRQLEAISPNILSNLKKLEELLMEGSFNKWEAEGLNEGKERASLDEIKHLKKLSVLEIDILDASVLPKDLFLENSLERYNIFIGECWRYFPSDEFSKTLSLVANNKINMEYGVFRLFENVEALNLDKLNGIASLYQSHITTQTFCKLRAVKVRLCDQLKSLFSVSMVGILSRLERIEVSGCKSLEEIVMCIDEENVEKESDMNFIEFLKLRSLELDVLPMLAAFCFNNKVAFPNLETLYLQCLNCQNIWDIFTSKSSGTRISEIVESSQKRIVSNGTLPDRSFSNLKTLIVRNCDFLLNLIPLHILKSLSNLEELEITSCVSLEVVFDIGEFNNCKETYTFRLKKLSVKNLPKLKTVWRRGSQGIISFQNLQNVKARKCEILESIFPASIAEGLIQLEELNVSNCGVEVIVAKDEFPLEGDATFVFPKLRILAIENCSKLEIFQSELPDTKYSLFLDEKVAFPNLESLYLKYLNCQNIWEISTSTSSGTEISEIVESSQMRILWNDPLGDQSFSNLKTLNLVHCDFILKLIPLHMLKSLSNLEVLEITSCVSLEVVFNFGEFNNYKETHTFRLKTLFLEKLPKLKTVWARGSQEIVSFQSIQKISIRECEKDEFPLEVDATFVFPNLRKLEIWNCNKLEIFQSELPDTKYPLFFDEKVAFPNLETLILKSVNCQNVWDIPTSTSSGTQISEIVESSHMRILRNDPLGDRSFSNLKTFKVAYCDLLLKLIPFHILKSLSNLEVLEIRRCVSLEVVFDFGEFNNYKETHTFRLKKLILENLSKLKTVWGRGFQGIVSFQSLQQISVRKCQNLKSIFPVYIAKGLVQLEELEISNCGTEFIVAKDEFPLEVDATFVFPNLRKLEIRNCNQLETFQSELPDTKYSLFFDEKVIPKLEELRLNGRQAMMMCNGKFRAYNFFNVKCLSLSGIYDKAATFPYGLYCGFPNLEELEVSSCSFEAIFFCSERPLDNDTQKATSIERLKLSSMKRLKHIWDGKCQVNHILQNLKTLQVSDCYSLINLGSSFVSLENLTNLDVVSCDKLINLLTHSTARTLMQLTSLRIIGCKKTEEIITNGEEDLEKEIVFMKLKILELGQLPSCKSFCCHNYNFKFPLLDEVIIRECPRFKTFCRGDLTTPLLKGVKVEQNEIHWQNDLNRTIQLFNKEVALFRAEKLKIDEFSELIDIWNRKLAIPDHSFSNLRRLTVDKCAFLFNHVIPSYVLTSLIKLQSLRVSNCDSVEVVFDLEGIDIEKEAHTLQAICLSELRLDHLPNLKYVWNKDPHTIHCFQHLRVMSACECESLRSIFPTSIAKGLTKLEWLDIKSCGVEVIVAEDQIPKQTIHFAFPQLLSLRLIKLPNLKNFYPRRHTVEWPRLAYMDVRLCKKVKVFGWEDAKITEKEAEDGVENQYPLFSFEKVVSKLRELVLSKDHVKMIRNNQFQDNLLDEVRTLGLDSFIEDELLTFPYALLEKFPILRNLNVSHSSFKDIFPSHGPLGDTSRKVPLLTSLSLTHLDQLQNIWNEDSKIHPVLQSLKILNVHHCSRLINLAPSFASFDNLNLLTVSGCHCLDYLLTTSTFKSLVHLRTLAIKDCKMLEEIVTNEGKDVEDIIVFKELFDMELIDLPVLKNFCSQTCTFKFLSWMKVTIKGCSKMKMFCPGVLATPLLQSVKVEEDEECWEGNLNKTLERLFLDKASNNLSFSESQRMFH